MTLKPPPRVAPAQKQAVDAPRQSVFLIEPEKLKLIGLDTEDGPEHCLYDETVKDPPDDDLALSLGEFGQRQTIVVRKNGERVEVVSGRTRTKAARLWNARHPDAPIKLACMFVKGASQRELLAMMIVENEHRRNKPEIVRAKQAARLYLMEPDRHYVARVFKVELAKVNEWLGVVETGQSGLVDTAEDVQKAMESRQISTQDGLAVVSLPTELQSEIVMVAKSENVAVPEVVRLVKDSAKRAGMDVQDLTPGARVALMESVTTEARTDHRLQRPKQGGSRRRGNSTEPSTRPNLAEIRAAIEDKDGVIPWDRISPRDALKWSIGDLASLVANDA